MYRGYSTLPYSQDGERGRRRRRRRATLTLTRRLTSSCNFTAICIARRVYEME